MRLENLLGRHVRYKGEEGRVVEGHADVQASVVVSTSGPPLCRWARVSPESSSAGHKQVSADSVPLEVDDHPLEYPVGVRASRVYA